MVVENNLVCMWNKWANNEQKKIHPISMFGYLSELSNSFDQTDRHTVDDDVDGQTRTWIIRKISATTTTLYKGVKCSKRLCIE